MALSKFPCGNFLASLYYVERPEECKQDAWPGGKLIAEKGEKKLKTITIRCALYTHTHVSFARVYSNIQINVSTSVASVAVVT